MLIIAYSKISKNRYENPKNFKIEINPYKSLIIQKTLIINSKSIYLNYGLHKKFKIQKILTKPFYNENHKFQTNPC